MLIYNHTLPHQNNNSCLTDSVEVLFSIFVNIQKDQIHIYILRRKDILWSNHIERTEEIYFIYFLETSVHLSWDFHCEYVSFICMIHKNWMWWPINLTKDFELLLYSFSMRKIWKYCLNSIDDVWNHINNEIMFVFCVKMFINITSLCFSNSKSLKELSWCVQCVR